MITKKDLIKEIKRQTREIKQGKRYPNSYNFLGFVENKELTPLVESYFKFVGPTGYTGYDWVKGNKKMRKLIDEITNKKEKQNDKNNQAKMV